MAYRYITIEIENENWKSAKIYFNTTLFFNLIITSIIIIPAFFFIMFLDKIISIPINLITDVKFLFLFLLLNFLISMVGSSFGVALFASNKLHVKSIRVFESKLITVGILIFLFTFQNPAVFFIGISALISTIYLLLFEIYYTSKIYPEIIISPKHYVFETVKELFSNGVWNSIIRIGQILLEGLDLLIANLLINPIAMGILALVKIIPNLIIALISTISNVFLPDFIKIFAKNNLILLSESLKNSMKLMSFISNIPSAIFIIFGQEFFKFWLPNQDSLQLYILSIIPVIAIGLTSPISGIHQIFTVTKKIKTNALILIITGLISTIIVFILLTYTNLELFAVVGVSSVFSVFRNYIFTIPYGAIYLNLKWNTFYLTIFKSSIAFFLIIFIGFLIKNVILISSLFDILFQIMILVIIGVGINLYIVTDKKDRIFLVSQILRRSK